MIVWWLNLCNQCPSPLTSYLDTTLYDKFVSDLRQLGGFSPGSPVSSTNKTDRHDITEILLKVALNTIKQTNKQTSQSLRYSKWNSLKHHTNHFAIV